MSIKVLIALLGQEAVEKMSSEQIRRLTRILDDEILADDQLAARLSQVVTEAARRVTGDPAR